MSRLKSLPPLGASRAAILDARGDAREIHDPGRHRRRSMTRGELLGAWVADRFPLSLQGRLQGRFAIGGRELGLVALLGALALCVVAVLALRSSAAAASPSTRTPGVVAASGGASQAPLVPARSGSIASGVVVIDVTGAVRHPGVVTLPAGSRVYEALRAAGGPKRGVETTNLNLARVMVDGEQIVVGGAGSSSTAQTPTTEAASSLVSINHASESELEALPGIGPVMSKNIVDWRDQHGGFTRLEDLEEVAGIGPKTFDKLKSLIQL